MKTIYIGVILAVLPVSEAAAVNQKTLHVAAQQRILIEKMGKEMALIANEIEPDKYLHALKQTYHRFDTSMSRLRTGDPKKGVEKVKHPKISQQLNDIACIWDAYSRTVKHVMKNGMAMEAEVERMAQQTPSLHSEMDRTIRFYEARTRRDRNPALLQALKLADQQRMLTQKISKEYFLMLAGQDVLANHKNMQQSIAQFDRGVQALLRGDDELGISPPPTEEIKHQIQRVNYLWRHFRKTLEAPALRHSAEEVARLNLPLMWEINKVVRLYEDFKLPS